MYRFGREEQVPFELAGRTWLVPVTSPVNRVFYPLDWLTHRFCPDVSGYQEYFHGVQHDNKYRP